MIVSELSDLASRLSLGPIHRFGRLAVVPLIDRMAKPSGWLTLDAALAGGEVEVTEVSESGSVPELCLLNRSSFPIFLLDGEELVGAKQNRILNLSILVPAASNFEVPVSCVEQGRWSWRSRGFQSAGRVSGLPNLSFQVILTNFQMRSPMHLSPRQSARKRVPS